MDWMLHPAWQYGLQIAGLVLCLYLFLSLKREANRAGALALRRQQAAEDEQRALRKAIQDLRSELRRLEERAERLVEPPPAASGLNIGKRSQVVRMHRRGEAPGQIAAALSLPEREVELLLKVEKAAMASS
jgi:hypothetical protein